MRIAYIATVRSEDHQINEAVLVGDNVSNFKAAIIAFVAGELTEYGLNEIDSLGLELLEELDKLMENSKWTPSLAIDTVNNGAWDRILSIRAAQWID